jgi:hypothetical protein
VATVSPLRDLVAVEEVVEVHGVATLRPPSPPCPPPPPPPEQVLYLLLRLFCWIGVARRELSIGTRFLLNFVGFLLGFARVDIGPQSA